MKGLASIQKEEKNFNTLLVTLLMEKTQLIRKADLAAQKEASVAAAEIEVKLAKGIVPYLTPVPFDNYFKQWVDLYKRR